MLESNEQGRQTKSDDDIFYIFLKCDWLTDKHTSHYGNVQYNRMNIISDDNVEFSGFLAFEGNL